MRRPDAGPAVLTHFMAFVYDSESESESLSDGSDIDNNIIDDIPKSLENNLAELASGLAELERECEELLSTELSPEDEALLLASLSMVYTMLAP